ncbi:MAG TPA: DUF3800 domain-containing protein [Gammaproteobacteria bacterium]|nr:DUF3800 domain-containing protein [Gammaproteobacteria bacterium]
MIITAYMDESGTHDDSPVTIMSGYLGNTHQWNRVEKKIKSVFREFKVNGLHARDFLNRSGEFRGWNDDKRAAFFLPIRNAIVGDLILGFSVILKNDEYDELYCDDPALKRKRRDSKYGMCLRYSLEYLMRGAFAPELRNVKRGLTVNLVLESGHKNAPDATRVFNEVKIARTPNPLGTLSFQDKSCIPLVAGDLVAYASYQRFVKNPDKERKRMYPKKRKPPLTMPKEYQFNLTITKENLIREKEFLIHGR